MQADDFASAVQEAEDLLWAAQPEELQAGLRILACQVAYAQRHQTFLSVADITEWLEAGRKDPKKREIVAEGMERLVEVLRALGIKPAKKSAI
jgi:hypothetical protein